MTCGVITWLRLTGAGISALTPGTPTNETPTTVDQSPTEVNTSRPAPDFTLTDLNGNQVSLGDFSGQPVVVNFWATWCPPCLAEMPLLAEAYQREGGKIVFLAVSVDEPDSTVRRFAEKNDINLTILLDGGGRVASDYKVRGIPVTFFISRDGEVVVRYVGEMSPHTIEEGLKRIR
jgi:peroxiredoxin